MHLKIYEIAYHRNGVGGLPFHAVRFMDTDNEDAGEFVGIVFALDDETQALADEGDWINPPTAVLTRAGIAEGDIAFGSNSWRGDHYDKPLRAAIKAEEDANIEALIGKQGAQA